MKAQLFALALVCMPALAGEMVTKSGANEVHLVDSPCVHAGTMGLIKAEYRKDFRKAWASIGGKYFYACWMVSSDAKEVFVLYEDGDYNQFPVSAFKYQEGV